jgi:hypothetical protein
VEQHAEAPEVALEGVGPARQHLRRHAQRRAGRRRHRGAAGLQRGPEVREREVAVRADQAVLRLSRLELGTPYPLLLKIGWT